MHEEECIAMHSREITLSRVCGLEECAFKLTQG